MKIIYMNDTLCLMQDRTENEAEFNAWVLSGKLKSFNEKPYLVIIKEEE